MDRVMWWVKNVLRVLLAVFMVGAGVQHFRNPEFFIKIMPPYIPWHAEIVAITGVMEIALGVGLLIPQVSHLAAWALMAFFVAIFPANIHVYLNRAELFPEVSDTRQLIRLPLQGVLIVWAFWYTRRPAPDIREPE